MNNELQAIITNLKRELNDEKLVISNNNQLLNEVTNLQKQLLSASILKKPNLEAKIKRDLQILEYKLVAQNSSTIDYELAYLQAYIREKYD